MEGTIFMPAGTGPFPAVLILHGLTSSENRYFDMAEMLQAHGIAALTVNLRGHGSSEGALAELTGQDGVADGFAAYDFLASYPGIDSTRIGMCGSSYGGMIAATVAGGRPMRSLILRAPATYSETMMVTLLNDIMAEEKTIFRNSAEQVAVSPSVRAIENFKGDLLVVASENDDIIPRIIPQAFYDHATAASRREFEVMAGAPHSLTPSPVHKQQFNARALQWFSETL